MKKTKAFTIILIIIVISIGLFSGCVNIDTDHLAATISVESIDPAPGSILPPLGNVALFTFTNISWTIENMQDDDDIVIVVLYGLDETILVGWEIIDNPAVIGTTTISANMPSCNTQAFNNNEPNQIILAACNSQDLIDGIIGVCKTVATTEVFNYNN